MAKNDTGVVSIHGKEYKTVAHRINEFREKHPEYTILTELVSAADVMVVMRASILDGDKVMSTGFAEEVRGSTNINRTSALENCETSAVGRALAFFGMAGTEIASADEVANAINQQADLSLIEHNKAVRELIHSVSVIKGGLESGDLSRASEAWFELTDDEKKSLWVAPTKGGMFTTKERDIMKSPEFRLANGEAA